MSAEEKLLGFLKKLGVEDVLPQLKAGGISSIKELYDRSFEEWRSIGISYGDCCYLDSSKPEQIEDDEEIERIEKEKKDQEEQEKRKKQEEEERKAQEEQQKCEREEEERNQKEEKERLEREEAERKLKEEKEREEEERKEKEEKERLEKEEEERKEKEEEEERRKEKEEKKRRKQERKEKKRQEKEELLRKEQEEIEEERIKHEKEEAERKEAQEREELERREEEDRKAQEKQAKKEEKKRKKAEKRQRKEEQKQAELEEQERREALEKEEQEKREKEQKGDEEKQKGKKKKREPGKMKKKLSSPKLPSFSLNDLPLSKKHSKALSARESSSSKLEVLDEDKPASPRTARTDPFKKPRKEKKNKEKKENEKVEFKVPALPLRKKGSVDYGSERVNKKKSHKKTLSSGFDKMAKSSEDLVSPRNKGSMLKNLSIMGYDGKRKNSALLLSPREMSRDQVRRNTVSELYPPEMVVTFIDPQKKRIASITKCQAFARGFLARKFFQRWRVAHEILTTEKTYVEDLDLILRAFVAPLEKRVLDNNPIIDRNNIYYIFYNLREIHAEHQTIMRLLNNRVHNIEEFRRKGIADIFSTNVAKPLAHLYFPFVNNFASSIKALKRTKKVNHEFAEFITKVEAKPECHLQDLESLLIEPIQRVTRYSILLKSLLGKYKPGTPQHDELESAFQTIKERLNEINECKRDAENLAYVDEMLRSFSYEKGVTKLEFSAKRRFVREGTVYRDFKHKETKPIYLILFSDSLVVAKMKEKKGGSTRAMVTKNYYVRDVIMLVDISKISLAHANEKECKSFVFHTAKKEYQLYLMTTEHCRSWMEIISATLAKAAETKMNSIRRKKGEVSEYHGLKKPTLSGSVIRKEEKPKDDEEFSYG